MRGPTVRGMVAGYLPLFSVGDGFSHAPDSGHVSIPIGFSDAL
ncbi:MAG: hypothetical protein PWR21_78 [Methanoculleus sp.]|nr:hypothetical protein [Methanoculleus sp.]